MSDGIVDDAGSNVEISDEIISQEIESEESGSEVAEEAASEIEAAIEDGATKEEIQEMIEVFKFKANGQEKEVTLDWNNKDDIIRRLQMAEAAQPAMQRAAELEKNFEKSINDLVSNPWEMLKELGIDPDELAEQRIQDRIAQLQKSPEQVAQEERDSELEELRQKLNKQEEEKNDADFARMQREAEVDFDRQITEALSSTTELPKSPYVVKRVADAMLTALENGYEDVTAKDVIPWVEKEINGEMSALFEAMPDKMLESYIGQKNLDRLRKGRLQTMTSASQIKDSGKNTEELVKPKKKIKMSDWLKHGSSIKDL